MVRAKKPWALAGLAALLIGMSANFWFTQKSWSTSHPDVWSGAKQAVSSMSEYARSHSDQDTELEAKLTYLNRIGEEVSGNVETRLTWLEICETINSLIPRTAYEDGIIPSPSKVPLEDRIDFYITEFDNKHYEDVSDWYSDRVAERYKEEETDWAAVMKRPVDEGLYEDAGPTEEAWVIQLKGFHYYNSPGENGERIGLEASNHIRKYLTTAFKEGVVRLPDPDNPGQTMAFTPQEVGLSYPMLLDDNDPVLESIANPDFDPLTMIDPRTASAKPDMKNANGESMKIELAVFQVLKQEFTFQVVWHPKTLSERLEAKQAAAEAAAAEAAEAEAAAGTSES